MTGRPAEALDTQRELVAWWSGPAGLHWASSWMQYLVERIDVLVADLTECQDLREQSVERIRVLRDAVAAEGFAPDEPLPDDHPAHAILAAETAVQDEISARQELARERYRGMCAEHVDLAAGGDWLQQRIARLQAASTYWVAEPMATLVNAAYDSMPEHTLRVEDVPCPVGFMLIDGSALLTDRGRGPDREDGDTWEAGELPPGFAAVSWEPAHVADHP